jgi:hypothetical protein
MKFQVPKGVKEYLPPESAKFELVREQLIAPSRLANYQLMETAVFEDTGLFTSGVGESTDVVSKEMYTFTDRADRSLTLRPEGTAGVMRAVIESGLDRGQLPVKVWYSGAFFRAERPQAGRYRQFYQVGVEAIGGDDPLIDVEVISLAVQAFKNLGLKEYEVQINSLGDKPSRELHREALVKFLNEIDLDEATQERAKINPLRVLDDKRPEMIAALKNAPVILDYLTEEAKERYAEVKAGLSNLILYLDNKTGHIFLQKSGGEIMLNDTFNWNISTNTFTMLIASLKRPPGFPLKSNTIPSNDGFSFNLVSASFTSLPASSVKPVSLMYPILSSIIPKYGTLLTLISSLVITFSKGFSTPTR